MEELLEEQQKTNELLRQIVNQNEKEEELLTVNQIHEEFGIGVSKVRKMFEDPDLPVQKYTIPYKVKRKKLLEYMDTRHDYLCE